MSARRTTLTVREAKHVAVLYAQYVEVIKIPNAERTVDHWRTLYLAGSALVHAEETYALRLVDPEILVPTLEIADMKLSETGA